MWYRIVWGPWENKEEILLRILWLQDSSKIGKLTLPTVFWKFTYMRLSSSLLRMSKINTVILIYKWRNLGPQFQYPAQITLLISDQPGSLVSAGPPP